jgi:hypothetical protein
MARVGQDRKVYKVLERKETTWKTKAWMGGWDQNGPEGDWLEKCRLDPVGSE